VLRHGFVKDDVSARFAPKHVNAGADEYARFAPKYINAGADEYGLRRHDMWQGLPAAVAGVLT